VQKTLSVGKRSLSARWGNALSFVGLPFVSNYRRCICRDDYVKGQVVSHVDGDNLKVVDIACGTGKLVQMLATKLPGCQVTGMDIDESMVERARSTTEGMDNVTILKGSCVEQLPFDDATVDVVIESLVFHHL